MKRNVQLAIVFGAVAVFLAVALVRLSATQPSLKITSPGLSASSDGITFKLELQCSSNGVAYMIQSSTNLKDWQPLLPVKSLPGQVITVGDIQSTNKLGFYRALEYTTLNDTNPPTWSNGVNGRVTIKPPGSVLAKWDPASDNFGVAEYRIYLNGVLVTNVWGTTLSYQFMLDLRKPADIRIQAADVSGNLTTVLSLVYLPGDKLLAVSDESGRVYTSFVQADGAFSPIKQIASLSGGARGLGLGDFDHDGVLDLIGGGASGDTLTPYFMKGNGDGTFAAPVPLQTFSGASSYMMDGTVGDFDADGNLDFVVNGNERYVYFYWGNGDGTFQAERKDWGATGRGLAAGDFNEDGRDDLIRGTYSDGRVRIFLSNGDRSFTQQTNWVGQFGSDPYGLAAGDFDEDGHLDILQNSSSSGDIVFYKGVGDGSFVSVGTNGLWANLDVNDYGAMDAFDFNGDGHLDLVMSTYYGHAVYFWPGNGDGTFGTNRVTVTTAIGNSLGITAPTRPPRVDVNIAPANPTGNLNANITLSAVGSGVTGSDLFRWTFGGTSTNPVAWTFDTNVVNMGQTVSHAWTNEGRFLARLWHTDAIGRQSARGAWVTVKGAPPVANPGGPYSFGENVATQAIWYATLNGSASTDDFGIVSYVWSFGDGAVVTNSGPKVFHAWTNSGVWLVNLTVIDSSGQSNAAGTTVTFTPGAPPVAAVNGPTVVDETSSSAGIWTATFYGTNSTDDVRIWKYDWNFGNGKTGSGSTATTTFTATNNYTIRLTVTDHAGQTNSTTMLVTVKANDPPVPGLTGPTLVDETTATNGTWYAPFSGATSTDDVAIWKYDWNFGNGRTASGKTVMGSWTGTGNYTVTLTVTDNAGQARSTNQIVTVKANGLPVPLIGGQRLLTEAVATNGLWFGSFDGLGSTDDTGVYRWDWNFGDGSTATGSRVTHNYAGLGVYRLGLTVFDNGNQSVSVTQNVIVIAGNPPVARISASTLAPEGAQPVSLSAADSTDDFGIISYRWLLPPSVFSFDGQVLDTNQWRATNVTQNDKLIVTGNGSWGKSYFYAPTMQIGRGVAWGATLEGRVDSPSTTGAYAMIGFRDLTTNPGDYKNLVYAIYFVDGNIQIYEYGNNRGQVTSYAKGTSYDFRIEAKPGAGARYYLRPSGSGQSFTKIYESNNYSDGLMSVGADVDAGVFGFDDLAVTVSSIYTLRDITIPVWPGGSVTLEVADNALQTNSMSVVVAPVTGAPPAAVISGPTNGLTGVELAFNGYGSSDDYAIASYSWNFGDGSPQVLGPAVTHHYGTVGTYTNTLTVMDYAGQSSSASLFVTISGSNSLVCVPWLIVNGILQPHEVYSGKTTTLKAVARALPVPFTNIWEFGDGTGSVTNVVSNSAALYNLEASHAYTGGDGTPYYARATVILTNGTTYSDTYFLVIRPKTLDTEMKVSIDEGLWYMHKTQSRYDIDVNNKGGDWTANGYKISATASSVHAFGINGHLMTDDANRDPYVETVQRGVNYLLTAMSTTSIGPQTYGDPDGNHNGIGLSANSGSPIYETGPILDAFVAVGRPELIAPVGVANVKGRMFKDILQDLVDMFCWGQSDYTDNRGGGWRYGWNQDADNSACQWGAIGMFAAERFWGIAIPDWVKDRNLVWLAYSSNGNGFGYGGPGEGIATTPSGLVQLAFDGVTTTNALWIQGERYVANNWSSGVNYVGANNVYANYAVAKAMRTANPQPVHNLRPSGKDWFLDPVNGLARVTIDRQYADGHWIDNAWVNPPLATAWSVIILTSSLFQQGPVAVINVKPNPSAMGYPVVFDGSSSYHRHPSYKVVEYRWVFDSSKGLDFDHPDAIGPVVTNVFGSLSTNTVSLQVRDNGTPQLVDVGTVVVQTTVPPYPPVADSGGPYVACVGADVHLNGSASFCVDSAAGNYIQSWGWEVDFLSPFNFTDVSGPFAVITNGFTTSGAHQIGLRVKNANSKIYTNPAVADAISDAFTTVYVYDRVIADLRGRPKAGKIQLTWTKAGDYSVIQRSTLGPDRGFQEVGRTDSSFATFLDTGVEYNVEYYYRVFAYMNGQPAPLGVSDPVFVVSPPRTFDEHAPHFQSTPQRVAQVGQPYNVTLDAIDPENKPIYYSLLSGPNNMSVNATSGAVKFTPTPTQVGNQFVSFQVTNSIGRDVLSYTLFVMPASNTVPVANANGPYTALTGQAIQFSSAGTGDPDNNPLRYYWNFGDGSPMSTNLNPSHTYGGVGDYLVTLHVNDGFGGSASSQARVHITRPNRPPVIVVTNGPHYVVRLGESLTVDASGSYDLDGNPLTFLWTWGDGDTTNNTTGTATHVYPAGGPYDGRVVVFDNQGGGTTNNFDVTVGGANQPPLIAMTVSSYNPYVMTTVTFDATGTTDPESDPMSFEWDFGDHSKTTGPLVTHVFKSISYHTVILKVSDNHGGVSFATQTVHAVNAPPVFTSTPPLMWRAGTNYTYTPTLTDLDGDTSTFELVQGPATMSCDTNTGTLTWLPGTNDIGPNAIVLRANDANGDSTDQSFSLVITTPLGPQLDLEPTHIAMTNVMVDSQTLALSGTVKVFVHNNGSDDVPVPFTVSVFTHAGSNGSAYTNATGRVGYGNFTNGFPANGLGWIEISVQGLALFKDAPLYAFVDSENVVAEYDKSNNIRRSGFDADTNNPPVIDLSASALVADRTGLPAKVMLTARLGNAGLAAVPTNVPLAYYDGDPTLGGVLIGVAQSANPMEPGMYEDLGVSWNSPTITNHTVFVVAGDPGTGTNSFNEITLSNNTFSVAMDLAAVDPPIANAGPNQNVYVGDTVILNGRDSKDPQGKPLTYRWSVVSFPLTGRIQLSGTNTPQASFPAESGGLYVVQLIVNNGIRDSAPDTVTIGVTDTNINYPPSITSTPPFQGMVNVLYQYPVAATDPQSKPLAYRLTQFPAGMTINTNTGLVKWTPGSPGSFFVQVAADGVGGTAFQGYSLTIITYTNLPPQFTSTPVQTASPGVPYAYTAVAVDPNLDTVTYALTQKPTGMSINASSGAITWTPATNQMGGNVVKVAASDGKGGAATQTYNLVVLTAGAGGPLVAPIPDQTIVEPATFAAIPLDSYVVDPNYPDSQIKWAVTGTNKLSVAIDSNRVATITFASGTLTTEQLTFLATDPDGKSAYASALFTVRGVDHPPVAAIANLSDTEATTVTTGSFDLRGTADDPDLIDAVAYRVGLYDASGSLVADVTPPPLNSAGWHEGRVPAGGILGKLDFTLVRNGGYILSLDVRGGSQAISATALITLDQQFKVGQMRFSQQDVVLPVQGVGLQVIRTYDSLDMNSGDFGYGWTYAVADLDLTIDEQRADTQDIVDGTTFSLRTGGTRDVTLNMPDTGRRITFRYSLVPAGMFKLQAIWTPPPGVTASLAPTVSPYIVSLFNALTYWEAAPLETSLENFDFPGFILTTKDGTRYRVEREDLGDHWLAGDSGSIGTYAHAYGKSFLVRIAQTTGERTDFVHEGVALKNIQQYDAANNKLKSILFQRDGQGRISAVYTPENIGTNGTPVGPPTITYAYDLIGNLSKVNKLMDDRNPSNLVYSTKTYIYGNPRFPHYITEIKDPRGVSAMRTEYDTEGRVSAIIDAFGKRTEIQHNLAAKTETVYDRLGNPTVFAYDDRGNVTVQVDPLGGVTQFDHDANNNLTMQVDPLGNTNRYSYDAAGNLLTHTDPLGKVTANTYDANSRLLTTKDPLGRITSNGYDAKGNLTATTNANGGVTLHTYDASNNKSSMTDPAGNITRFEYDSQGNLSRQTDALGNVSTYAYDGNGNKTSESIVVTVAPGVVRTNTTHTDYNPDGAPTSVTDGSGATKRTEYDALGNVTATVDALGHRTEFRYDDRTQLSQVVYPDGTTISYTYDDAGRRTTSTDRAGRTTYYEYDVLGRLITTIYPDDTPLDLSNNPRTRTEYDAAGRAVAQSDELGNRTTFGYDAASRQIAATNALGAVTLTGYDAAGQKTSQADALGNTTFFLYDNQGRMVRTVFADGASRLTSYDALGRISTVTDQAGAVTRYEYDALGDLTATVNPLGQRTEYAYDEGGGLVLQRDVNGHQTRYARDPLTRSTVTTLPLGQRSTALFNGVGKPSTVTNFNGGTIRYEYDVNNLLSAQRFPEGGAVLFSYTPTGRRQSVTDARGVTRFTYDSRDRLLSRIDPDGRSVQYEYDAAGNRTKVITFNPQASISSTQSFTFDALNRLQTVKAADGGLTRYSYNAVNNLVLVQLPNGTLRTNAYDVLNRLTLVENRGISNVLSSYRYTLGPTGNRIGVQEANGRQVRYDYDPTRRLVRETVFSDPSGRNRTNSYGYDGVGNRLYFNSAVNAAVLSAEGVSYAYDLNDQLLAETNVLTGEVTAYAYDSNGNTLSQSNSVQVAAYQWNSDNRLVGATITDSNGVRQLAYQYDPDGIRVAATVIQGGNTNHVIYLVDANAPHAQVLEEWDSQNGQPAALSAAYTYGRNLISQNRGGAASYYLVDGLGSTRALTDPTGALTDTYDYDAFGRTMAQSGTTANSYLFAGEQRDKQLGLDYLRARYMAPSIGRFYGQDPVAGDLTDPVRRHRYLYAGNDPVNMVDPSGAQFDLVSISVSLAINTTIEQYQVAFARAGARGIQRTAKVVNHIIGPGVSMQYLGLDMLAEGDERGNDMMELGIQLEQTGYRLLQSIIAGIYVEAANSASINFTIGPLKVELSLIKGNVSWGKTTITEYGIQDYDEDLKKILDSIDKIVNAVEGGTKADAQLDEGADELLKWVNKALDKISKGPSTWDWKNKK